MVLFGRVLYEFEETGLHSYNEARTNDFGISGHRKIIDSFSGTERKASHAAQ